jgi:predicted enzyme related to lactoylglutathione lyase
MSTQTAVVTGVDFVCVPTRDITAAMEFYSEVLGLESSKRWQRGEEEPLGAEFEPGDVTIALLAAEKIGIEFQPNKVPIALHVEDVEAARAALEAQGVSFFGDTIDSGVCHMANFADTDGNALMLHHRYAPPGEPPKGAA